MASNFQNPIRRVIPRWRTFNDALERGELDPGTILAPEKLGGSEFLTEKETAWLESKGLGEALDLVNAANVLGITDEAKRAAEFVLGSAGVSPLAQEIAAAVAGVENHISETPVAPTANENIALIRRFKQSTRNEPRNAFAWAELARLYALLGMVEAGKRPMRVALALAPMNRFIVRNASRFLLHAGDPDEALSIIRKSPATKSDPWLVAAELAVSSVAGKSPKLWNEAGVLVSSKSFAPLHTSELEAAMGSIELWDGHDRHARQHFINGMTAPSENALAQVVWAARDAGMLHFPFEKVQVPRAFEAEAFVSRNKGDWETSFQRCRDWAGEESFSSRPYGLGSGIAASIIRDFDAAVEFARGGLHTNPGHPGLQNNIAFALAEAGRAEEAEHELAKVDLNQASIETKACLIATAGLIAYRLGRPEEGKAFYESTIQFAVANNKPLLKATAQLYLAREEARVGHSDFEKVFAAANDFIRKAGDTFAKAVTDQVNKDILHLRKS